MKNNILLKVSSAVATTLVLGSTLSATAYAQTRNHQAPTGTIRTSASRVSTGNSYDQRVVTLVNELQTQMDKLQHASVVTGTGRQAFTNESDMTKFPWIQDIPRYPTLVSDLAKIKGPSEALSFESRVQRWIARFIRENLSGTGFSDSQTNPGGPMIPTSSSNTNPGGPMIPASNSNTNPGGPMIPASNSQTNPGGPMIPASSSNTNPGGPMIPAFNSDTNPGGPMIPASSSDTNPGGPMIPASSSDTNPGGPMIPASSSDTNPGGPLIPASNSSSAFRQLALAANSFVQVLQSNIEHWPSATVNAEIRKANLILRNLKASFQPSALNTQYSYNMDFTPTQLAAVQAATQSLEHIVPVSGPTTR